MATNLKLEDLIAAQQKMATRGDTTALNTIKKLESIQAEFTSQNTTQEKIAKAITDKEGDGLNANVKKLVEVIKKDTKKRITPDTQPNVNTPKIISGDEAQQARLYQPTGGKFLQESIKKLGDIRSWVDLSEGSSQGFLGQAIRRRVAKQDYIRQQMELGVAGGIGMASKRFDYIQRQRGIISDTVKSIEEKRKSGVSEEAIQQSGLFDRLGKARQNISMADPTQKKPEGEARAALAKATTTENITSKVGSIGVVSTTQEETQIESENLIREQTEHLRQIAENTNPIKNILNILLKKPVTGDEEGSSPGSLDFTTGLLAPLLPKIGGVFLGLLKGIAAFAIPAIIAWAVAKGGDWILGRLGVGKDERSNDLVIDEKQDEENWNKMTTGQKIESGLIRGVEKAGDLFMLDNVTRQAKFDRIQRETEYLAITPEQHAQASRARSASYLMQNSAELERMRELPRTGNSQTTNINAPTNIQQTSNYAQKSPPRNTDSSWQQYNSRRYLMAN